MNIEEFRDYCLSKKGVTESFPFNELTLVFKIMGKMFAFSGLENQPLNLDGRGMLNARDEENFMNACALMNSQNSDEFCYALKDLVDKNEFINEF